MVGERTERGGDAPPVIYFYYPLGADERDVPECRGIFIDRPGKYVWTVKTYGYLSQAGFPCRLTARLPDDGVIISHREFFADWVAPNSRQLFVCIVADYFRHSFAQLHLVQNRRDPMLVRKSRTWPAAFLPHWPETGLIPRDPARADRMENVSYFGMPARLAPQLRTAQFAARMHELGFTFRLIHRSRWNDYSDTDAVLAVRSFAAVWFHKFPPSKLYNSWIAGVPALLGPESAYQAERRNADDYFEVRSVDEVLTTLRRLREDKALRQAVARNCAERAAEVSPARLAAAWIEVLNTIAIPAYWRWRRRSSFSRGVFLVWRALSYTRFVCVDFVVRGTRWLRKQMRVTLDLAR